MNRELLMLVDAISREKSVDREVVFGAVEAALASASKKLHGGEVDMRGDVLITGPFERRLPGNGTCLTRAVARRCRGSSRLVTFWVYDHNLDHAREFL